MVSHLATRRFLVGFAIVTLLAGCASGATPTSVPSVAVATPGAVATPTPPATTMPSVKVVGSTAQVAKPTGKDDTGFIQAALDACVTRGPGCVVQLQAGTYRTSQLVATGFRGTFKGAGKDRTIIEALPALPVTVGDFLSTGECVPNLTDCRWPSLIVFVDGAITVSDLAIHVTGTGGQATKPWTIGGSQITSLVDALRFMVGRAPTSPSSGSRSRDGTTPPARLSMASTSSTASCTRARSRAARRSSTTTR